MKKGITPVIAIIVLLFITIALAGAAWTYLQGFMFGQMSKSFSIPTGGAYCEAGVVKIYILNNAYESKLYPEDFILHDIDGTNVPIAATFPPAGLEVGNATLVINDAGHDKQGYLTVNLGTSSTVVHQRVYCS